MSKVNFLSKNFPVPPPLSLADKFSQKIQKLKSYLLIVASGWVGGAWQTKSIKRNKSCLSMVPKNSL